MYRVRHFKSGLSKLSAIALSLAAVGSTHAQDFDVPWAVLTSGSDLSLDGGTFVLSATLGQGDSQTMSSPSFQLVGGFWNSVVATPCTGDLDGDRRVTIQDLANLLAHFALSTPVTYADGDIDGNGQVTLQDLAFLLANFGVDCPR